MRQKTRAPGAARAIFSTSSTQSTAKSVTPELVRAENVALLLDGVAVGDALRRRRRSPSTISISGTEAASKDEPSEARRSRISGAGFAFTA